MDAKERLAKLERDREASDWHQIHEYTQIQALIEIREALDKQTMALDRLTEEVRAGRNRTI